MIGSAIDSTSKSCSALVDKLRTDPPHPSVPNEFLDAPPASHLRRVHVPSGINGHVVQEHELAGVATNPTELSHLFQRTSIEDANSTISGIRHIEVLLLGVLVAAETEPHRDDNGQIVTHHWLWPEASELIFGSVWIIQRDRVRSDIEGPVVIE